MKLVIEIDVSDILDKNGDLPYCGNCKFLDSDERFYCNLFCEALGSDFRGILRDPLCGEIKVTD